MDDPTRYQLRLKGPARDLLNSMCEVLKATPKDVILDALAVFHYAMTVVQAGEQFGRFDSSTGKFTAIVTPSLQRLSE